MPKNDLLKVIGGRLKIVIEETLYNMEKSELFEAHQHSRKIRISY